jgi:hypothetical protein
MPSGRRCVIAYSSPVRWLRVLAVLLFSAAVAAGLLHTWWEVPNVVRASPPRIRARAYRSLLGETLVITPDDLYIVGFHGDRVRSPNDSSFQFLGGLALSTAMRPRGASAFKAELNVMGKNGGVLAFQTPRGITLLVQVE